MGNGYRVDMRGHNTGQFANDDQHGLSIDKIVLGWRVPSLEAQADSAISGNLAGNGDAVMIEERLAQIPEYVRLFKQAFGSERPLYDHALKAIAVRTRRDGFNRQPT
ncbi:MAG: hypothetical protein R3C09_18705 [Pirellulaceae bacterium]